MRVVILAAGYAVRLQPLTLNTSKSLLFVGNKKIVDRIMEKVVKIEDVSGIDIVTNAKFFKNFSEWLNASKYKKNVRLLNDGTLTNDTRLGAIRDIEFAIRERSIDDDVLVIAGDNLFDFGLSDFLKFAAAHYDGVSVALHDIGDLKAASNFGVVAIDGNGKVTHFEEKPENPKSTLVSTGIYYFPKNKLYFIQEYVKMQNKLDAPGYYISWLCGMASVYGFTFKEDWYDIGNKDSYKKANEEYLRKEK